MSLAIKYSKYLLYLLLCLENFWSILKFFTVFSLLVRITSLWSGLRKVPPPKAILHVLKLGTPASYQAGASFMLNSHSEDLHTIEAATRCGLSTYTSRWCRVSVPYGDLFFSHKNLWVQINFLALLVGERSLGNSDVMRMSPGLNPASGWQAWLLSPERHRGEVFSISLLKTPLWHPVPGQPWFRFQGSQTWLSVPSSFLETGSFFFLSYILV